MDDNTAQMSGSLIDRLRARAVGDAGRFYFNRPLLPDGDDVEEWEEPLDENSELDTCHWSTGAPAGDLYPASVDDLPPEAPVDLHSPPATAADADENLEDDWQEHYDPFSGPDELSQGDAPAEEPNDSEGPAVRPASSTPVKIASADQGSHSKSALDGEMRAAIENSEMMNGARRQKFGNLQALSERVKGGEAAAMTEIQLILKADENLWRQLGDISLCTQDMMIRELSGGMAAVEVSVRFKSQSMHSTLLGANPTPLERMTVELVVIGWMYVQILDRYATIAAQKGARMGDLARAQELAQKRYKAALQSLKLARGIKTPVNRQGAVKPAAGSAAV